MSLPHNVDDASNDHKTYGYSHKGLKGVWDDTLRRTVYPPRPWPVDNDIRNMFPPHVACGEKEDADCVCLATLAEGGIREAKNVAAVHAVGFDTDVGITHPELR